MISPWIVAFLVIRSLWTFQCVRSQRADVAKAFSGKAIQWLVVCAYYCRDMRLLKVSQRCVCFNFMVDHDMCSWPRSTSIVLDGIEALFKGNYTIKINCKRCCQQSRLGIDLDTVITTWSNFRLVSTHVRLSVTGNRVEKNIVCIGFCVSFSTSRVRYHATMNWTCALRVGVSCQRRSLVCVLYVVCWCVVAPCWPRLIDHTSHLLLSVLVISFTCTCTTCS